MELLVAFLIAFGVTTNKEEAKHIAMDSGKAKLMLSEKGFEQAKIEDYKESIIGLEDTDM